MTEPIEITDLDQLTDIAVTVSIPLPDGREARVKLRPLSAKEVRDIRKSIKWPERILKDFAAGGKPVYDDAAYDAAMNEANALLVRKMLVASLLMHIPGANDEEKCAALDERLGASSTALLIAAVSKMTMPSEEDIANVMRSFRTVGDVGAAGDGEPVTYPVRVESLIESGALRDVSVSAGKKRTKGQGTE